MKHLLFYLTVTVTMGTVLCDFYDVVNAIDLSDMIKHQEKLLVYIECLTNGNGCTPEYTVVRKNLRELLATCCSKCTAQHKMQVIEIGSIMVDKYPEQAEALLQKYDPELKGFDNCAKKLLDKMGMNMNKTN